MDMPESGYFYALASLAVTFVGFSAIVIYLRQTAGGALSRLDVLITRIFIQLGFIVVAGAMLPSLLALFRLPADLVWRIASAIPAVPAFLFAVTYPARRRAASGVPTPLAVWIDILVLIFAALVLAGNAAGAFTPGAGPLAAGLTTILFLAGWGYLQALNTLLVHHAGKRGAPASDDSPAGQRPTA